MNETSLVKKIQVRFSKLGARIFRNNVGMLEDKNGTKVRYGLCTGSSDLIGWKDMIVTPEMVGRRVAVFVSVEVKSEKGQLRVEQYHWLKTVENAGGIAMMVKSEDEAAEKLQKVIRAYGSGV